MKKHLLLACTLLTLVLSACNKSETTSTPTELMAYPSSLISTPIITSSIPAAIAEAQTPINIDPASTVVFHSNDPELHYGTMKLTSLLNNEGENLKVSTDSADKSNNYVVIGGKKYNLAQFHFHYTSEHTIGGKYSAMEIHFVNVAADNSYAVLGVLVDLGTGNNALQTLFSSSPKDTNEVKSLSSTLNLADLFPTNTKQYYTYSGSLTTPNFNTHSSQPNGGR